MSNENQGREITPQELSDQLRAEDALLYANSDEVIRQYVDETGQLYYQNEDGEWVKDEG